jgi:hypothetical protein
VADEEEGQAANRRQAKMQRAQPSEGQAKRITQDLPGGKPAPGEE